MSESVADLYVVLTANTAALLASFAEAGAAGEAMTAQLLAATAEMDAAFAGMGASGEAATAALAASTAEIGTATEAAAATVVSADDEMLASMAALLEESKTATAEIAASYTEMAATVRADVAGLAAAEGEAAAANEALAAKMAGTSTEMGTASVAAGTFKASLSDTAGMVGMSSGQLLGLGAAAGVVAVATVKMAGDFQQNTTKLVTSANETQANLGMVRDGILSMAGSVGYSAEALATAMYKVESGGQHGADGLKVLQAAAEGAKTENADLTTVADALTSAMTDYHAPASAAADITSKLVEATASGKMTFQELAGSLSSILPVASANHVALNDILGDMASMTMHGMSAQQAAQNLADAIRHMAAPTMAQSKELAALGLNATQLSQDLGSKGLSGTIGEVASAIQSRMGGDSTRVILNLNDALKSLPPSVQKLGQAVLDGSMSMKDFSAQTKGLDVLSAKQAASFSTLAGSFHTIGGQAKSGAEVYQSYSGAMQKAMGTSTGMNVALMLTGENAKNTATAIGDVGNASAQADGHVKGWAEIQDNFNQKMSQAKDGLGAMAIAIGEKLLPVVTPIVDAFASFTTWISQNQVAATIAAVVIGGILVVAFVALGVAAATAAVGVIAATWPILLIVAAVALLAFGIYELISNWSSVVGFFQGIWDKITGFFQAGIDFITNAWDDIVGGFQNADAEIGSSVDGIDAFFLGIGEAIGRVVQWFTDLPGKVGSALSSFGQAIIKPFVDGWNAVVAFFSQSPQQIGQELGRAAAGLVRAGAELIMSIHRGIVSGVTAIYTFFSSTLPNAITSFIASSATWLMNTGIHLINGLNNGIVNGWNAVKAWFIALPGNIMSMLAGAAAWLLTTGKSTLDGFLNGIVAGYQAVVAWLYAFPGNMLNFFNGAGTWLLNTGGDIIQGLWNGVQNVWNGFWGWIGGIISGFIDGFKSGLGIASPSTIFLSIGQDVIQGLWNGVQNIWNGFIGFVQTLPSNITNLFANAGQWLVNAGYNVVMGLWNGIQSVGSWLYNAVSSWATGIVNAAKSALGIASPSKHTHEMGMYLAQGLANGLDAHTMIATAAATRMSQAVLKAANPGGISVGGPTVGGGSLAATASSSSVLAGIGAQTSAPGGGGDIHVHVNVAGSVKTEQDLVSSIAEGLREIGLRNTGNGTTYRGFAGSR